MYVKKKTCLKIIKNKKKMSDEFFNKIYPELFIHVTRIARSRYENKYNFVSYEDFVQHGIISILTMRDGLYLSFYINRASRRMKNYDDWAKRILTNDTIVKEFSLIRESGKNGFVAGGYEKKKKYPSWVLKKYEKKEKQFN